jgi:hypothetical protein
MGQPQPSLLGVWDREGDLRALKVPIVLEKVDSVLAARDLLDGLNGRGPGGGRL